MVSNTSVRIALVQMQSVLGDPAANVDRAGALLAQAASETDIACLPELFSTGYDLDTLGESLFDLAEPVPAASSEPAGPTIVRLCHLARELDLAIVAGIAERDPAVTGLLYDSVVLIDHSGGIAGRYRKTHLYPAEHRFFRPGDELPVFDVDDVLTGIAICFEHAFPPIFTTLALGGAQVVFNPSAVPVGFDHLQDLRTRARAQDNQLFVAAVNHVGAEGDVTYCGGSQVADPRGDVVVRAPNDRPAVVRAELDMSAIRHQRLQEPTLRTLRPDLYRFGNP
jgi:predicted amidohydrolase